MKKFPAVLFTAILVFFLSISLFAQEHVPDPVDRANKLTEWMRDNLKLTPDQVPKVQDINLRYANKMAELKHGTQPKQEKMTQLRSLSDQKDTEMKGVLTADQYNSYLARKKELEKRMKEKMKDR